jgi:dCMP deaminase
MPAYKPERPTWDHYFIEMAYAVSTRADCTRRHVGAVIVDEITHDVISTGYNGSAPGERGCLTNGACPRGLHYQALPTQCGCGNPWPCPTAVEPYSSYDTGLGTCIAIHAEANAILRAGTRARGAIIYSTGEPCYSCMRLIKGAMIHRIVWPGEDIVLEEWD